MQRFYNIPAKDWEDLKRALISREDIISEEDAATLLGIKVKTLREARSKGKLTADCYCVPKVGKPVYFKSKLLNL